MNKKALKIGLILVALIGIVGAAAYFTKGFTSMPSFVNHISEDDLNNTTKYDYRSFDFTSEQSKLLTKETVLTFFNESNQNNKVVFSEVATGKLPGDNEEGDLINLVYADKELGLKLGDGDDAGYLKLKCSSGYKYDHLKIEAVNYNRKNEGESTYDKEEDGSSIAVNGMSITLRANSEDQDDLKVTKTLVFAEKMNTLTLGGVEGRPCILKLELWSE